MKPDIQALFEKAESFDELLELVSSEEVKRVPQRLWQNCALVEEFDRDLYRLLGRGLGAPPFEEFVKLPYVRAASRTGRYALRRDVRSERMDLWGREDPALKRISARLARHFSHDRVEKIRHLICADPNSALKEFRQAYREADARFDLSRCDALLRVVRDRYDFLSDGLREALADREQYYQSRSKFSDDYYATLLYIERKRLMAGFRSFMDDDRKWGLNIVGKGGMGKTMFVRWLVAHHCLPEREGGERTPVARVDMDSIDLPVLESQPWLLLLPVAVQLRPQLPRGGLATLIGPEEEALTQLLRKQPRSLASSSKGVRTAADPTARRDDHAELAKLGLQSQERIESLFTSGLGKDSALVILDTVEELLLHYPTVCASVLDLLDRLRSRCPGMRILVSGRYDPLRAAPPLELPADLRRRLETGWKPLEVGPFTKGQSRQYLRRLRRLGKDAPVEAMVKKSEGNPFVLSKLADLAPTLKSVRQVEECPVEFAYLIERVIDRIPDRDDHLRWLLRYAVIPRSLTKDFLKRVLAGFLRDEISGRTRKDDPSNLGELGDDYRKETRWQRTAADLDIDRLWAELESYSASNSWIVQQGQAFRLEPEVVVPMRELLRQNPRKYPIYDNLHAAAARYFEESSAYSEVLYHHFQRRGSKAAADWSRALRKCRSLKPEKCRLLAESLFGSDYVDDLDHPLPHFRTGRIISRKTLAEAALESAASRVIEALLKHSRIESKIALPVRHRLKQWKRWTAGATVEPAAAARARLAEAAALAFEGKPREAAKALKALRLPDLKLPEDRVAVHLTLAFCEPEARVGHCRAALRAAGKTAQRSFPRHFLEGRLGLAEVESGRLDLAWKRLDRALDRAVKEDAAPDKKGELLLRLSDLSVVMGGLSAVREHAAKVVSDQRFPAREEATQFLLRHDLERGDIQSAELRLEAFESPVEGVRLELQADLAAARYRIEEARKLYISARQDYNQRGFVSSSVQVTIKLSRFLLETLGNPKQSVSLLEGMNRRRRFPEPILGLEFYILSIRQSVAVGEAQKGRALYAELAKYVEATPELSAPHQVLGLATLLAEGLGSPEDAQAFLDQWRRLKSLASRLAVLRPFLFAPPRVEDWGPLMRGGLNYKQVELPYSLYLAAARRFFGQSTDSLLKSVDQLEGERIEVRRRLRSLGWRGCEITWREVGELAEREPAMAGVLALEEAERLLEDGDLERAVEWLDTARPWLDKTVPGYSQWSRRAKLLAIVTERPGELPAKDLEALRGEALEARDQRLVRKIEGLQRDGAQPFRIRRSKGFGFVESDRPVSEPHFITPAILVVVRENEDGKGVVVDLRSENEIVTVGEIREEFYQGMLDPSGSLVPYRLVERMESLKEGYFSPSLSDIASRIPEGPMALRIDSERLAAYPWEIELAQGGAGPIFRVPMYPGGTDKDTLFWLARLLGLGPDPLDVLSDAFKERWLEFATMPHPRAALHEKFRTKPGRGVLIVAADPEAQLAERRGHALSGLRLEELFAKRGLECHTIPPDPELVRDSVKKLDPALIYLAGSFRDEEQSREVTLDFASGFGGASLPPYVISAAIQSRSSGSISPAVVLEAAYDPKDRVRQILLRNLYATMLASEGGVRGVFAVGPYEPPRLAAFLEVTADSLARGDMLSELQVKLWAESRKGDFFSRAASAVLIATDPELPAMD